MKYHCLRLLSTIVEHFGLQIAARMLKCKKKLVQGARDTMGRAYFCGFMMLVSLDIMACADPNVAFHRSYHAQHAILKIHRFRRNPPLHPHGTGFCQYSYAGLLCTCFFLVVRFWFGAVFSFFSCFFARKKKHWQRLLNFYGRRSLHGMSHAVTHTASPHAWLPKYWFCLRL